ncbi:PEGA domain-containing protein [Sorangium sp. So ce131]|uniref:PEGA domain-containing protein n=1 Tax=Sorangium sp. So ce131 TaxID=3133282 RepID=UPI003F5D9A49
MDWMTARRPAALLVALALVSRAGDALGQPADTAAPAEPAAPAVPAPSAPAAGESAPAAGEGAPAAGEGAPDRRAEAEARFYKGRKLYEVGAFGPALAEFLASRELYPNRSATSGAAACLKKLQRFDEALELFEILLRDFADTLPADAKTAAQREVLELRGLVGTIEIEHAEPGASISVGGQRRGDYPLLAPLRVPAGSHVVHVDKDGFEPLQIRVDVAGGRTARVAARMRAIAPRRRALGRLRVAERYGQEMDVLVDGNLVGRTPWEGEVEVGEHTVVLRGDGDAGTEPIRVNVQRDRLSAVTPSAEDVSAFLRIEAAPDEASVAVDAAVLADGAWEGRLRPGEHDIEVSAPGFVTRKLNVHLTEGKRHVVRVALELDLEAPRWRLHRARRPGQLAAELGAGLWFTPSLGGDVAGSCFGRCDEGVGLGGLAVARGGYLLESGLELGLSLGYLGGGQTMAGRRTSARRTRQLLADQGTADDALSLRGVLAGAFAGLAVGADFPIHLRLGAGALLGSVSDRRTGAFLGQQEYQVGPAEVTSSAPFFYLAPELRLGVSLHPRAELSVGVETLLLFSVSRPRWDAAHQVSTSTDAGAYFSGETLAGRFLLAITPGLGIHYKH